MAKTAFEAQRNAEICEAAVAGADHQSIADRWGLTRQRVQQIIRAGRERAVSAASGWPVDNLVLRKLRNQEIVRRGREGQDPTAICETFGLTRDAVCKMLRKAGVYATGERAAPLAGTAKVERDAELTQLADDGASLDVIAAQFDLSPSTVERLIASYRRHRPRACAQTPSGWVPPTGPYAPIIAVRQIAGTSYGYGPDVEAADALTAARDAMPLWGGRYPTGPSGALIIVSALGAVCGGR